MFPEIEVIASFGHPLNYNIFAGGNKSSHVDVGRLSKRLWRCEESLTSPAPEMVIVSTHIIIRGRVLSDELIFAALW